MDGNMLLVHIYLLSICFHTPESKANPGKYTIEIEETSEETTTRPLTLGRRVRDARECIWPRSVE